MDGILSLIEATDILLNPLVWLACLIVLFFSLLVSSTRARRRKNKGNDREVNEAFRLAMRAVQDARERNGDGLEQKSVGKGQEGAADAGDQSIAHFGHAPMRRRSINTPDVQTYNTAAKNDGLPTSVETANANSGYEPDLYFEPFVNLQSGRVSYYNIYLMRSVDMSDKPVFDRAYGGPNGQNAAAFDHMMIERSIAASRQVFATLGNESRLIVPCGNALLENDEYWHGLQQLFIAQNSLITGLVFAVSAEVFSDPHAHGYARLIDLHQSGAVIACRGFDLDLERADREFLMELEGVISDLPTAFRVASAPELVDRQSVEAFQFFQSVKMPLFVEDIITDSDAADAIDLMAKHGSGSFFGQPRRLRDATHETPLAQSTGII